MNLRRLITTVALTAAAVVSAEVNINYSVEASGGLSSGKFAPHYLTALQHGRYSNSRRAAAIEARIEKPLDLNKRFSWSAGVALDAAALNGYDWDRFDGTTQSWYCHHEHPARAWVQEAYGQVKYRGVFATAGLREHESALLNQRLTSGDLVESGNSRPVPEIRVGFIDFQNIPFTNGWVQIQGEISYGKMTDSDWWANRYNRYTWHYATGQWLNYKRCYFRTNPAKPLSVTLGMQAADQFGGTLYQWSKGEERKREKHPITLKTLLQAWLPMPGGEGFYEGNHLGTWDLHVRYTLPGTGGQQLLAYIQKPWEDGSGIGFRNGWDGLWGLEWRSNRPGIVNGAVVEYIDFTNQSGPIHYAPNDFTGSTLTSEATGADDYYNNAFYNSYANYGLSIGSPMVMAPAYNLDGYMAYVGNRMRGFHVAVEGQISLDGNQLEWRARGGYRKAWGNGKIMLPSTIHSTSLALDASLALRAVKGLKMGLALALDHGTMPGNSVGALATVTYSGNFTLSAKQR